MTIDRTPDDSFHDMDDDDFHDNDEFSRMRDFRRMARERQRERQHQMKMEKIRNQHDIRMQKLMDKSELKQEHEQTKAEKFLAKNKSIQDKAKNKSKVKLIAKLALAAEVLKFMIDHHDDEEAKLNTKDKIALEKAKKEYGTNKKAQAVSNKMQKAGLFIEPTEAKEILSHTQNLSNSSFVDLLNKIKTWVTAASSSLHITGNSNKGSVQLGDWGFNW